MLKLLTQGLLYNTFTDLFKIGNCISRTFFTVDMSAAHVVQPKGAHKATVIFLHGLGDTGHGWSSMMSEDLSMDHVKFICPNAPTMPVTLNMGMRMPAWYDIRSLSFDCEEDGPGIKKSVEYVHKLIAEEEKAGIPSDKIVVGGFSQGGAVSLYSGLTYKNKLAGIIGLSCYLPLRDDVTKEKLEGTPNFAIKTLMCHGDSDQVVSCQFGEMTKEWISRFNSNITLKKYPNLPHSSCPQEMRDVKNFLEDILGNLS